MKLVIDLNEVLKVMKEDEAYHLERYGSELDADDIRTLVIQDGKVYYDIVALSGHSDKIEVPTALKQF